MPQTRPPTSTRGLTRCKREIEVVGMRGALAAMLVRVVVRGGQETEPSAQEGGDQSLLCSVTFVIRMDTHCYGSATRTSV
jgi:hypothetical protein